MGEYSLDGRGDACGERRSLFRGEDVNQEKGNKCLRLLLTALPVVK